MAFLLCRGSSNKQVATGELPKFLKPFVYPSFCTLQGAFVCSKGSKRDTFSVQ